MPRRAERVVHINVEVACLGGGGAEIAPGVKAPVMRQGSMTVADAGGNVAAVVCQMLFD